jgi:hypothetical protein
MAERAQALFTMSPSERASNTVRQDFHLADILGDISPSEVRRESAATYSNRFAVGNATVNTQADTESERKFSVPERRATAEFKYASSLLLQEWEGYVTEVASDTFAANLMEIRPEKSDLADESADFLISDLSDSDRKMLRPGAIFRWTIGYEFYRGEPRKRVSKIVFRRLPAWSRQDLQRAKARANELKAILFSDSDGGASPQPTG